MQIFFLSTALVAIAVKVSIKCYRLAPLSVEPHHRLPIPFSLTSWRVLSRNLQKDLEVGDIFRKNRFPIPAPFSRSFLLSLPLSLKVPRVPKRQWRRITVEWTIDCYKEIQEEKKETKEICLAKHFQRTIGHFSFSIISVLIALSSSRFPTRILDPWSHGNSRLLEKRLRTDLQTTGPRVMASGLYRVRAICPDTQGIRHNFD